MFDNEYLFKGTHAVKVNKLTAKFPQSVNSLFKRNIDVFVLAPIVGVLYNRMSDSDSGNETTKIFPGQFTNHHNDVYFTYRLVMLALQKEKYNINERVNKAFNGEAQGTAEEDFRIFEKYLLGGIDVLYEKLIEMDNPSSEDDYISNLKNFLAEIHERYEAEQDSSQDFLAKLEQIARE